MKLKEGVILAGLKPEMRKALVGAEKLWRTWGRTEGVTVTSGLEGAHSACSLHYYGYAVDLRTYYFSRETQEELRHDLQLALGDDYDVILESNHIHVEYEKANRLVWREGEFG